MDSSVVGNDYFDLPNPTKLGNTYLLNIAWTLKTVPPATERFFKNQVFTL